MVHLTPKAAARVSASSPKGDAAFACYVFAISHELLPRIFQQAFL